MNKLAQKKISFIDKLASRLLPLVSFAAESKMERRDVVAQAMAAIQSAINNTVTNIDYKIFENKLKPQLGILQSVYSQLSNDNSNRVDNLSAKINQARDAAKTINTETGNLNSQVDRLYNLQSAARGVAGEGRAAGKGVDPRAKERFNPKVEAFQKELNLDTQNGILDGLTQQAVNKNPELARKYGLIPDIYPTDDEVFGTSPPTGVQVDRGFFPTTSPSLPTGGTTAGPTPLGTGELPMPTQNIPESSPGLQGPTNKDLRLRDERRKEEEKKRTESSRKDKLFSFAADEELKNLQAAINKRYSHYKLPVTGDLDPKTSAAIKDMIRIYKLPSKASYVEVRVHVESPWAQPDKYNPEEP